MKKIKTLVNIYYSLQRDEIVLLKYLDQEYGFLNLNIVEI